MKNFVFCAVFSVEITDNLLIQKAHLDVDIKNVTFYTRPMRKFKGRMEFVKINKLISFVLSMSPHKKYFIYISKPH